VSERTRAHPGPPGGDADALVAPPPEVSAGSVGRALSWLGAAHVASQATWFASLLLLAAFVPPRAFGLVSAALVVTSAAQLVIGSGTRGALITARHLTVEHLRYALALNAATGVLLVLLVAVLAAPVMELLLPGGDPSVLRWLLAGVALHALSVVPLALLERQMEFKRVATITAGVAVVVSLGSAAAALLGAGVWALVVRQVGYSALFALVVWVAAGHLLPAPRRLLGRIRRPEGGRGRAARWFFVMSVFWEVKLWADTVVVGRVGGPTQLGLYSLAFTLGFAPLTQFAWKLGDVLLPAAAATQDLETLARRTIRAMRVVGLVLVPFVVPAVLVAPWAVPAVLGERWAGMVVAFQILLPVGVAQAVVHVVAESLSGSGSIDLHARLQALWTALLVPALVVLVPLAGIRGAALAQLAVTLPVAAAYLVVGARRLGLGAGGLVRPLGAFLPLVAAQLAVALAVGLLLGTGAAPDGAVHLLGALAAFAAALLVLWATPSGLPAEGRSAVGALLRRG